MGREVLGTEEEAEADSERSSGEQDNPEKGKQAALGIIDP